MHLNGLYSHTTYPVLRPAGLGVGQGNLNLKSDWPRGDARGELCGSMSSKCSRSTLSEAEPHLAMIYPDTRINM